MVAEVDPAALQPANTPEDWWASEDFVAWGAPLADVRGEEHHLDALRQVLGTEEGISWRPGSTVLRREADNPSDANAIRVEAAGQHVGYLAAEIAEQLSPFLDSIGCADFAVAGGIWSFSRGTDLRVYLWLDHLVTPGPFFPVEEVLRDLYPAIGPHGGVPLGAVEAYFDLRDEIKEESSNARIAALAKLTLPLLDDVVEEWTLTHGSFWTSVPPAVALGAYSMAKEGDTAGIDEMRATLEANPQLRQWLPDLERQAEAGATQVEITDRVLAYVREHPGVLQKDLYKLLGADKDEVSTACDTAQDAGLLEREFAGRTYSLTLVEERP